MKKLTWILVAFLVIIDPLLSARNCASAYMVRSRDAGLSGNAYSIALPDGEQQRFLYLAPAAGSAGAPNATLVMLPGGAGDVGIERDGDVLHGDNFLIRTRALWAAQGFAIIIPDRIDDASLRGLRSSRQYAGAISQLVVFAHKHASGPVFLVGTSQGSIAAMNGAAHAASGTLAGVVLTESVSIMGGSHETVFDSDPQGVRIPALIVANHKDSCRVAPPGMASRIGVAMVHSPKVKIAYVNGGTMRSQNACGSLSPHGYFGIEANVVQLIADWVKLHR
jgi:hypothetical protein